MKVFLGSSTESLDHLGEIAMWLEELKLEPVPWNLPTLFMPGENTFLKLIEISKTVDAAIFIFAEDDRVWYRADTVGQPRDNVLLEYGLFVGALGPKRAIICKRGKPKPASDLLGINWVDSSPGSVHRARVQLKAWAQDLAQSRRPAGLPTRPVNGAGHSVEATASGCKAVFRGTNIFVDFGLLQSIPLEPGCAVVLPANEYFDERCFGDQKTAAGAFIQQHFPNRAAELKQIVRSNLPDSPVEVVTRPGRKPLESFGVATCAFLREPLGARFHLIFAAVASDRPPEGLRTDLSTIFKVVEQIRCLMGEERIASVYIPLLGAGKGGVAADIAFHTMVSAVLDARCKGGGHLLGDVHVVVYAPEGRPPQLAPTQAGHHLQHLLELYQTDSR